MGYIYISYSRQNAETAQRLVKDLQQRGYTVWIDTEDLTPGARFRGGLSVLDFLRVRTWLEVGDPAGAATLVEDAAALGRLEGLEAHARSADRRRPS
jgi:hypothetical protein